MDLLIAQVSDLKDAASAESLGPRQRDPGRAVLLLHRRAHVAHPRGLHDVRDGRRATQERARHGDEEHPHDRRRHAELLLLRLVDLQLQHAGPADRPEQHRLHGRLVSGRDPLVRRVRAEPGEQHQPRLLPRVPALLVDDGVDHVRGAARAGAALGLPRPRGAARLGRLDPRRRLGLELRRLADAALRLPRLDRVRGGPRRLRRLHARRALQPRAAHRQIHEGGPDPHLQTPQHPYDPDGADADLHGVLRLLCRLPGDRVDHDPRLGEHLPQPDDPGIDRDDHHLRVRGRLHRRVLRQPGRPVLDGLRWPRRRDQRLRRAPTSTRRRSVT